MRAFKTTDGPGKGQVLAAVKAHRAAERLVQQGHYWHEGRGCAVGCTLHDFAPGQEEDHRLYEALFGIPEALARVEDNVFESLPARAARAWPLRFIEAIPVGADLSGISDRFLLWLLQDGTSPLVPWQHRPGIAGVARLRAQRARGHNSPPQAGSAAAGSEVRAAANAALWTGMAVAGHSGHRAAGAAWTRLAPQLLALLRAA